MRSKFFLGLLAVLLFSSSMFAVSDKDMGIIINLAGKQRMLSQKMTKQVFLISIGIEKEENIKRLKKSSALFDKTLKGLMNGDKSLKLKAVNSKTINNELKNVQTKWKKFYTNIKTIIDGKISDNLLKKIEKRNIPLLKNMHKVVMMYVKESKSLSNIDVALAVDINYAGRQRMLTQKMSKELLLISKGINKNKNMENLNITKALFEKSLMGLISGDKEMGLKGSKLTHITKQLKKVQKLWNKINPNITPKIAGDKAKLNEITKELLVILREMNNAVKMYEKSVKRQMTFAAMASIVNTVTSLQNKKGHVINLAGKQRMLTQKMSKETLLVALNISKKENIENLKKTSALYNKTLNGFINGDKSLKLSRASDKLQKQLSIIKSLWIPFYKNIKKVYTDKELDKLALNYIIKNNVKLLKATHKAVLMFKNDIFENSIGQIMTQNIDLAGKQRMLTQKMTKEKLLVIGGMDKEGNFKKLKSSISLFDKTIKGLIEGDASLKLTGTTLKHLKKQLYKVQDMWNKLKPVYSKEKISDKELSQIIKGNLPLLKEMNRGVKMFEDAADY